MSKKVLEKVKKLVNEARVYIPHSNIDRAHRIGPKKDKKQAIIVKFTTFRHRTLLYRAGRKLKNGRITKPPTTDNRPPTHRQVLHQPTDHRQPTTDPPTF